MNQTFTYIAPDGEEYLVEYDDAGLFAIYVKINNEWTPLHNPDEEVLETATSKVEYILRVLSNPWNEL